MSDFGRRKLARLRREYLYRKGKEHRLAQIQARKEKVNNAVENDKLLPGDIRNMASELIASAQWDDSGPTYAGLIGDRNAVIDDMDDEYRHAGEEDPKIFLTTSHSPSVILKKFVKEVKLLLPDSVRMNRGTLDLKTMMSSAKANGFTDVVILHETRGRPDQMIISHLPNGPTAYFTLYDVKLRHDIPDCPHMSEAFPHLVFHNFETRLGKRIQSILKYLYPVPKADSQRMMMFTNHSDFIIFRHYVEQRNEKGKVMGVIDVGPQFTMMCHKIIRGTLDQESGADIEYVFKPYLNTAHKRLLLSNQPPWDLEEEHKILESENKDKERDVAQ